MEYMRVIAAQYRAARCPDPKTWHFDAGIISPAHQLLEGADLIERLFGTPRGYAWRLTAAGAALAKSYDSK